MLAARFYIFIMINFQLRINFRISDDCFHHNLCQKAGCRMLMQVSSKLVIYQQVISLYIAKRLVQPLLDTVFCCYKTCVNSVLSEYL